MNAFDQRTTPEEWGSRLKLGPQHDAAVGWWTWPNVVLAHRLLREEFLASLQPYPNERFCGRGVVICAGGSEGFTNGWVCVRMLRHSGCSLPVEFWHFETELDPDMAGRVRSFRVECIDADAVARGLSRPPRILAGGELKPFAALHSRFREVLLLDAREVPLLDPEFLFECADYRGAGAVFWPGQGRIGADHAIWNVADVPAHEEPEFAHGQMLLNKERCWAALNLTMHYNEHSDYYYRHAPRDHWMFQIAWPRTGTSYSMPRRVESRMNGVLVQHDFEGRRIFERRHNDPWLLDGTNRRIDGLQAEDRCRAFLSELAEQWNGKPFHYDDPSDAARELRTRLAGKLYLYHRVGYDRRRMVLDHGGEVGEGQKACERRWWVQIGPEGPRLTITGDDGVTCHLVPDGDGQLRGRWLFRERMPVELVPLPTPEIVSVATKQAADTQQEHLGSRMLIDSASNGFDVMRALFQAIGGKRYLYRRIGYDERPLELLTNGRIGEGSARCETLWWLSAIDLRPVLVISGDHGSTCRLALDTDGVFRGRWRSNEQMPVELVPETLPADGWCDTRSVKTPLPDAFFVGIPTLNRYELLDGAIDALLQSTVQPRQILVLDNGGGYARLDASVSVIRLGQNLGVARSWNLLHALVAPYPLVLLNDDVIVPSGLLKDMLTLPIDFVTALPGEDAWCCFYQRQHVWEQVGPYDECYWPAYYEDSDYRNRMAAGGLGFGCIDSLLTHGRDSTRSALSRSYRERLDGHVLTNLAHFNRKWGGSPGHERFDQGLQPAPVPPPKAVTC